MVAPLSFEELWLYTNLDCNLACRHCFLGHATRSSERTRPPVSRLRAVVDEAVGLGARSVFFTGGEPFMRDDLPHLLAYTARRATVCVLTNATVLCDDSLAAFASAGLDPLRPRVSFHVSIDGPRAIHDAIRSRGAFDRAVRGIKALQRWGARPALVTALTNENVASAWEVTRLAADLGLAVHHLLLPHRAGRMECSGGASAPTATSVLAAVRSCRAVADSRGVTLANDAVVAARVRDTGCGFDGCNGGTSMLAVGVDGRAYPCPLLVGIEEHAAPASSLAGALEYHRESALAMFSLHERASCSACEVRRVCGGGCVVRGWWNADGRTANDNLSIGGGVRDRSAYAENNRGPIVPEEPFCEVYRALVGDHMSNIMSERVTDSSSLCSPRLSSDMVEPTGEGETPAPRRRYACSCTAN